MTTPETPDQPVVPEQPVTPPPTAQPAAPAPGTGGGWGAPPRYGQYAPAPPAAGPQDQGTGTTYGQGQYGAPQYGAPRYGQTQYGQAPAYGAVPNPYGSAPPADKPGIVPLRPLSLGEIYDGAFSAIRHNPRVVLGLSAIVVSVAVVVGFVIGYPFSSVATDFFETVADGEDLGGLESMMGFFYSSGLGMSLALGIVAPLVTGIITVSVAQSVIGRKIAPGETWRQVGRRAWFLIGFSLLLGAAYMLALTLAVAVPVAVAAAEAPTAVIVVTIILVILALVVGTVWLIVRTLLVPAALALEGRPFWATLRRAWLLTRGSFWRLFGIYLLASFIVGFVAQLISGALGMVAGFLFAFGNAGGGGAAYGVAIVAAYAVQLLFLGGVVALQYVDLRMRREGLDVELAAAAQAEH